MERIKIPGSTIMYISSGLLGQWRCYFVRDGFLDGSGVRMNGAGWGFWVFVCLDIHTLLERKVFFIVQILVLLVSLTQSLLDVTYLAIATVIPGFS